jgi:hypothetical protein
MVQKLERQMVQKLKRGSERKFQRSAAVYLERDSRTECREWGVAERGERDGDGSLARFSGISARASAMVWATESNGEPKSRGPAVVILEQPAESLAADNLAVETADGRLRLDELVVEPLVVALGVVVRDEFRQAAPQHLLAKDNHPVETFLLHRANPPFREGIQVRRARRQANGRNAFAFEDGAKFFGELGVSVHQEVRFAEQESIFPVGQVLGHLLHPFPVGLRGNPGNMGPRAGPAQSGASHL